MHLRPGILAVTAIAASFFVQPTGLSAKPRRGASVLVTRLDGRQSKGELLVVKPDSLLLLSPAGTEQSIGLAEIRSVRIVRRSRALLFAGLGAAAGLAGTGALAAGGGGDVDYVAVKVLAGGGIGALAGFLAGTVMGIDSEVTVAGTPEAVAAEYWRKLSARSREGRLPGPAAGMSTDVLSSASEAKARPPGAPRFKIGLSAAIPVSPHGYRYAVDEGSFLFLGAVPPEESDVPPVLFTWQQRKQLRDFHFGPITLAYELTGRLSVEAELVLSGGARPAGDIYGELAFTSAADGGEYRAIAGGNIDAEFASLLIGATFRSKIPSAFSRHIFEVGAAAGPALSKIRFRPWAATSENLRKTTFSGRIQGGYDFYISPSLSIGALAGYRYLKGEHPGLTYSADFEFREVGNESNTVTRQAEASLPGPTVVWSGPFLCFRFGFRL